MNKKLLWLSAGIFTATTSFASITGPVTLNVVNGTNCKIMPDFTMTNHCAGPNLVQPNTTGTYTCDESHVLYLYYNPDRGLHPSATLMFNHFVVPAQPPYQYTYFMQSYAFTPVAMQVQWAVSPSKERTSVLTGQTSQILSDEHPATDMLSGNTFTIAVGSAQQDTCQQ